uniref:Uncharacterized protein n=1 Tax=Dicentrarchus labrax TaxID=13489 RepID=A0A8C4E377_DICLA
MNGTLMSCPFSRAKIVDNLEYAGLILTSDLPKRSLLEMSKVSPVAAVSTPPVPLFCSRRLSRILEKRGSCGRIFNHL